MLFHQLMANGSENTFSCILIGAPLWYVVGVLITFSEEFGIALGAKTSIKLQAHGIFYSYVGIAVGDLFAGLLAQVTKSRKASDGCVSFTVIGECIQLPER
jgi:hypothetical protein